MQFFVSGLSINLIKKLYLSKDKVHIVMILIKYCYVKACLLFFQVMI